MSERFRKEVFQTSGGNWEYNIFDTLTGDKCIYQDFNPTVCGAQPMTEAEAHQFADDCIANLSSPEA